MVLHVNVWLHTFAAPYAMCHFEIKKKKNHQNEIFFVQTVSLFEKVSYICGVMLTISQAKRVLVLNFEDIKWQNLDIINSYK
jgi:hypothetical protein